jgi:hypothetical protein
MHPLDNIKKYKSANFPQTEKKPPPAAAAEEAGPIFFASSFFVTKNYCG